MGSIRHINPAASAAAGLRLTVVSNPATGATVRAGGSLVADTADQLGELLDRLVAVAGHRHIRVDMADIARCDRPGVEALLAAHGRLSESGADLIVLRVSAPLLRMLPAADPDHVLVLLHPGRVAS